MKGAKDDMQKATLRNNEKATLDVLHKLELLDTASEPEFDKLVKDAAAIFRMPIALISLVDEERQWFKAESGLPDMSESSRDIAFCSHAVLEHDILEVPDARNDPRFADNPFVAGAPEIRFYAGAPLSISGGLQIGTLCIMDTVPRRLTFDERNLLKKLANSVVQAIELRFAKRQLGSLHVSGEQRGATTAALLVDAMGAVEVALGELLERGGQTSFTQTTDLMALPVPDVDRVTASERAAYQAKPAMTAMQLCLTASSALIGITHELLDSMRAMTAAQRERAWAQLAADTKIAGRAAYRAALVLTDPGADPQLEHAESVTT